MSQSPFNREYKPSAGVNKHFDSSTDPFSEEALTYADKDLITSQLEALLSRIRSFISLADADMRKYALPVDNGEDKRLIQAVRLEWPSSIGPIPESISYDFFNALRFRDSTAASYIRTRYKEAARDVTGSVSLDLILLLTIIKKEVLFLQDFINQTIKDFNDSSEYRSLESVQDWIQSCERYEEQLRQIFQAREQETVPVSEVNSTAEEQARHTQAVLKVKLNAQNSQVDQQFKALEREFSDYSKVFYDKVLKPAVDYRLDIGRIPNTGKDELEKEVKQVTRAINTSLKFALADQHRRGVSFDAHVNQLIQALDTRNSLKNAIVQFSQVGKPLPISGPRVMVNPSASSVASVEALMEGIDFSWGKEEGDNEIRAYAELGSPHSALDDLDQDDHPQYLMKSGGEVTGDITFGEGATLDGIVPSLHRHTGRDGSPRISGYDILFGTLSDEVVDETRMPPTPTDLEFVSFRGSVNSGLLDATFAWKGDPRYTYEMQIARVEMESEEEEYR